MVDIFGKKDKNNLAKIRLSHHYRNGFDFFLMIDFRIVIYSIFFC